MPKNGTNCDANLACVIMGHELYHLLTCGEPVKVEILLTGSLEVLQRLSRTMNTCLGLFGGFIASYCVKGSL